jgi:death-on-curing protein
MRSPESEEPWDELTSVARVLEIHDRALAEHGGLAGPSDRALCVGRSLGAAFNAELYLEGKKHLKTGLPFASYALFYLARNHCFNDGNKRAAWATAMDVLAALGLGVDATIDEAVGLVEAVLSREISDGADVVKWISPRLFAIP